MLNNTDHLIHIYPLVQASPLGCDWLEFPGVSEVEKRGKVLKTT